MPIKGVVGKKAMLLTIVVSATGFAYIGMVCSACGERVCQYSEADLDEMTAEYGSHITTYHPLTRA